MKFLRFIIGIATLFCLVVVIFKAGSNLINTLLILSTIVLTLDLFIQWKNTI